MQLHRMFLDLMGLGAMLTAYNRQRLEAGIPTWRYLYHGNWSNLSPTPWLGAYHSSKLSRC